MSRLAFALLALFSASATAEMRGKALDHMTKDPIVGAAVYLYQQGFDDYKLVDRTGSNGQFSIDVSEPYNLRLTHDDYEKLEKVGPNGANDGILLCSMININGVTLTANEKALLKEHRSTKVDTLYLFPYKNLSDPPAAKEQQFNTIITYNLRMMINRHLQALDMSTLEIEVVPPELAKKTNRKVYYGAALNALGLLSGYISTSGTDKLKVMSEYRIVPAPSSQITLDDEFPRQDFLATAFLPKLYDKWVQTAVLSIAARDFENATSGAEPDTAKLDEVYNYLLNYRKDLTEDDSLIAKHIDKLLTDIKGRLSP